MNITVEVTEDELAEMDMTPYELKIAFLHDLGKGEDYVGYNIEVVVND